MPHRPSRERTNQSGQRSKVFTCFRNSPTVGYLSAGVEVVVAGAVRAGGAGGGADEVKVGGHRKVEILNKKEKRLKPDQEAFAVSIYYYHTVLK